MGTDLKEGSFTTVPYSVSRACESPSKYAGESGARRGEHFFYWQSPRSPKFSGSSLPISSKQSTHIRPTPHIDSNVLPAPRGPKERRVLGKLLRWAKNYPVCF